MFHKKYYKIIKKFFINYEKNTYFFGIGFEPFYVYSNKNIKK